MNDDVDYSSLREEPVEAPAPAKSAAKKSSVKSRSIVKQDQQAGVDLSQVAQAAEALQAATPDVGIPSTVTNTLGAVGGGLGILSALGALYNWSKSQKAPAEPPVKKPDMRETVFSQAAKPPAQPAAETPKTPMELLKQRSAEIKAATGGAKPPVGPTYNAPVANVPAMPPVVQQAPAPAMPQAPAPAEVGPTTVTQAVASGNTAQGIQKDLAQELDAASGKAHLNQINSNILQSDEYKSLVKQFGEPTHVTGSGMPAWGGQGQYTLDELRAANKRLPKGGEFTDLTKVPRGSAIVPGASYYDALANEVQGRENAQQIVRTKQAYPSSYDEAKQWAADFAKEKNLPVRNVEAGVKPPNTKGIFETTRSSGGKKVVLGGAAGALTMIPLLSQAADVAKEASKGNTAPAKEMGFDLASLAGLAQLFGGPAAMAGSAMMGGRGLNTGEEAELAKRWKKGSKTPAQPTID